MIVRLRLTLAGSLIGGLTISACGGEQATGPGQQQPPAPTVASVTVTPSTATLASFGETVQLTATASESSGNTISGRTFTWSSSNEAIATVSASGLVTAVANGSVTVTATADGVNGTAAIEVDQVTVSVVIAPSTVTLVSLGETVQLTASAQDASGNTIAGKTFTWSSSNQSVATVSSSGLVTAAVNGSVTITATADGVNGTTAVDVKQVAAQLLFAVEPTLTVAGAPITAPVQVAIRDATGNTVSDATDAVTVAIGTNPGGGTLSGTTTVSAVAGVASFTGLSIDQAGAGYTLVASSGSLSNVISAAFDILDGQGVADNIECFDPQSGTFKLNGSCNWGTRATNETVAVQFRMVLDNGTPVANVPVALQIDPTCLATCDNTGSVTPTAAISDASGLVNASWTLGPNTGSNRLIVSINAGGDAIGVWITAQ